MFGLEIYDVVFIAILLIHYVVDIFMAINYSINGGYLPTGKKVYFTKIPFVKYHIKELFFIQTVIVVYLLFLENRIEFELDLTYLAITAMFILNKMQLYLLIFSFTRGIVYFGKSPLASYERKKNPIAFWFIVFIYLLIFLQFLLAMLSLVY